MGRNALTVVQCCADNGRNRKSTDKRLNPRATLQASTSGGDLRADERRHRE